jgi:hypothetical protein
MDSVGSEADEGGAAMIGEMLFILWLLFVIGYIIYEYLAGDAFDW